MDDVGFEGDVPDDELAAVQRALAGLGARPLPGDVATRLDVRLAAELDASPLAQRRARRPGRLGASLTAAGALAAAAAVVFALSTGGGHTPAGQSEALRSAAPAAVADAKSAAGTAGKAAPKATLAARTACPPASRTAGGRPSAACPGARGGHARAV